MMMMMMMIIIIIIIIIIIKRQDSNSTINATMRGRASKTVTEYNRANKRSARGK